MADPDPESSPLRPQIHPRLVSRRKKTLYVFDKANDVAPDDGNEEDESFYDFSEISARWRIINDLEDE